MAWYKDQVQLWCGINEPIPDDDFLKRCREAWDTRWFSYSFAVIAPRISGSISALSSAFVLYIIYKSPQKLKSTYHRIMAAMSIYDIWSSTTFILGVLLFPTDIYYRERYRWPASWTRIGNVRTCEYGAFSYLCGSIASTQYVATLCLYYLCSLVFGMKKHTITKWIEWFLHLFPNASAWSFAITMLVLEMLNPSRSLPWCSAAPMLGDLEMKYFEESQLWYCFLGGREGKCIQRGSEKAQTLMNKLLYTHMFLTYSIIAISLLAICLHMTRVACRSKAMASSSPQQKADYLFQKQASKTVVIHSILYILSMTIPSIPGLLNSRGTNAPDTVTRRSLPLIFTPLGGLFSMITFVWGKVHGLRLLNPNMSRMDAFKSLFANAGVSDESVFFSNLELIAVDDREEQEARNLDEDDYDKILRQEIANNQNDGSKQQESMLDLSNENESNLEEIDTPDESVAVSSSSLSKNSGGMALSWGSSILKMNTNNEAPQNSYFYQDPNLGTDC